ncbi:glycerate kinase [Patescibacteria group bacterium]|nr:glycerate kinase [Patescibacteria group bacterium]MCL5784995.1 glycerate kinase [Patescibacteria group bacterium]
MEFDPEKDLEIFRPVFGKRPEVSKEVLKQDLNRYYLPYIQKLIEVKQKKGNSIGLIVGVSAIQGTGKTTQGEILEILLKHLGHSSISLSIDDHYLTHAELNELRQKDPRYIRRGVTHDITLAIQNLKDLQVMQNGMEVKIPIYDKGAESGDGDRVGWKSVTQKPDFIFYDGWMLGARRVEDESVFESGLPALDTPEHIQFAKDINKKLDEYLSLWDLIEFMNVLYVPNYQISLEWRDQAEEVLRKQGKGMSKEEIREFVYYFWRSVHPAIQIKNLAHDSAHAQQVTVINDDHSIKEVRN